MPSNVIDAGEFLIEVFFSLYILTFMLRFLFQWARVDFYNPISQFLVKVTNPLLAPMRRIIPGFFGLDFAAIIIMLVLQMAEIYLLGFINGVTAPLMYALVIAIAKLLALTINVFFFSLIIQAIISWVNPGSYNPVSGLLYALNEPLLRPARRILPTMSGIDLSPMLVLVLLQVVKILTIPTLLQLADHLAR